MRYERASACPACGSPIYEKWPTRKTETNAASLEDLGVPQIVRTCDCVPLVSGEFHMDYIDADHIRLTPRRQPHDFKGEKA